MTRLYLIGLTGQPGAGKDSCAEALRRHGYQSIAFADSLRCEIAQAWRVDPRMLCDRPTKEWPLPALAIGMCDDTRFLRWAVYNGHSLHEPRSARWLMQHWGTEYRRATDPTYWVDRAHDTVLAHMERGQRRFVITDVRFDNEAALLREWNVDYTAQLWQVQRPGVTAATTTEGKHASATNGAAFAPDVVITNAGTLDDLRAQVLGQWWALEAGLDSVRVEPA